MTSMNGTLISTLAPMVLMVGLGYLCRCLKLFTGEEIGGLKKLVSTVLLPFLSFSSLCTLKLDTSVLLCMLLSLLVQIALYGIGFLTTPLMGEYGKYHRFMICSSELGLIGYALFIGLFGTENLGYMTLLDAGQTLFFFCVVLSDLQRTAEGRAGSPVKALMRNPVLWALLLGAVLNLTGLYASMQGTVLGETVDSCISMATAPVTCLMLFSIGYGISIEKKTLVPVLKTGAVRLPVNLLLACLCALTVHLVQGDNLFVWAFLLYGCLPSTFLATAYIKEEKLQKHQSTFLSVYTLFSLGATILLYCLSR